MPIVLILFGCASIAAAFLIKNFHGSTMGSGVPKPVPRWVGRLVFVTLGLMLIGYGILSLHHG